MLNVIAQAALTQLASRYANDFPWYRALLGDRLDRRDVRLEDLPVIDEAVLTAHYYTASPDAFPGAGVYHTSGTANGARKRIFYAPDDDDAYVAQRKQLFTDFAGLAHPGETAVADLGTGHAAAAAQRIFSELGYRAFDIDFQRPIEEHIKLLNDAQPDVLFTMPMILDRLLQHPEALRISPRKIAVVGDLAPEAWRRHVAAHFRLRLEDVLDVFGSIEIGAIAYWCTDTGLYHFHDHILPEMVAPHVLSPSHHDDLDEGCGILLLTSFSRRYFPALRYATNDVIRGLRPIIWRGQPVYAFERIEGRYGGEIKHGERISNHDLTSAVTEVFPGAVFEVLNDRRLEIRVVTDRVTPEQRDHVLRRLSDSSPDVGQMIRSGLVDTVSVVAINLEQMKSAHAKRRFNLRGN
jgi:phenylacetate-coenzyme A ligase PaaK-like adenylate-forming protein